MSVKTVHKIYSLYHKTYGDKKMKKIIIIPDSFKGSLSSLEVCNAIEEGILKVFKNTEIKKTMYLNIIFNLLINLLS